MNQSYVIDSMTSTRRSIKMLFFGDYEDVWSTHFMSMYGFRCWPSSKPGRNDIYFQKGNRKFALLFSMCDIDLSVRG